MRGHRSRIQSRRDETRFRERLRRGAGVGTRHRRSAADRSTEGHAIANAAGVPRIPPYGPVRVLTRRGIDQRSQPQNATRSATTRPLPRTVVVMSQYMAWPTADGVWHIGTGLTLPPDASLTDLNNLLTKRHIDRAEIGFHRPNDETRFNKQFPAATVPEQS